VLQFDPESYGPACAPILRHSTPASLGPGSPNQGMRPALDALDAPSLTGAHGVHDPEMAQCCLAALWLQHDFLDHSHAISQAVCSSSGSYWHGIMHRREPDYSNAKYWFRRVGDHPIFPQLARQTSELLERLSPDPETAILAEGTGWDPFAFVDLCQSVTGSGNPSEQSCQQIADLEWKLLFDYCYRRATGQATRA